MSNIDIIIINPAFGVDLQASFLFQTIADKGHLSFFRENMTAYILLERASKCLPKTFLTPLVGNFYFSFFFFPTILFQFF